MKYRDLPDKQRRSLSVYVKLMRAANKVTGKVHEHLKEDNLTMSQFGVLEALYHLGPLSQGELGQKILKSNANLTTVVDSLERKALVERRRGDDDRRRITVHLTASGRELISRVYPRHAEIVGQVLNFLNREDKNILSGILKKFK